MRVRHGPQHTATADDCVGAHCSAKRNEAISKTLSLINVVYLPVSKYSISVFKCIDVGGRSVLSAFPNTDCSSAEYTAIFTAGCVGTAVYMVRAALARLAYRASSARPCDVRPNGLGPVPQSFRLKPNLNSNGKSFASPVTPAPVQQRMPQRHGAAPHSGSSSAVCEIRRSASRCSSRVRCCARSGAGG